MGPASGCVRVLTDEGLGLEAKGRNLRGKGQVCKGHRGEWEMPGSQPQCWNQRRL